jgi:hypothetical protein
MLRTTPLRNENSIKPEIKPVRFGLKLSAVIKVSFLRDKSNKLVFNTEMVGYHRSYKANKSNSGVINTLINQIVK